MEHSLLHNAVIYLAAAIVAVPIFRKLGLGAILGYLTAGALIGPQGLQFVADPEHTLHFAEFGVVMLLFVIGLELNPEKLWQMRNHIGLIGGGQLLLSAGVIALCFGLFNTDLSTGIICLIAVTLALSSTAFAVQLMGEQGIMGLPLGRKGFSILLLQDLAVIPILLFVGYLAPAGDSGANPWWQGPAAVVALLLVGRFALNPILRMVAGSGIHELLTASTLFIVLGSALLMQATGLTMGMGAFLAGIILGTSSFRHQLEADIEPFKGLLLGLFFIAVGMSLDLTLFMSQPLQVLLLALALIMSKCVVIAVLVKIAGSSWRDSFLLGLLLSQGGEFAFVVMNKAFAVGLIPQSINDYVVLVVGVSMALTSPLILLYQRLTRHHHPQTDEPHSLSLQPTDDEPEVVIAGFGRFGQIVGRILAANHLRFIALDKSAEHIEFVEQFGSRVFFGNATRLEVLQAAGLDHARIIVVAVDSNKDSLNIVNEVRKHYPKITIIARAHNRDHAYQLYQAGVKIVIRETLESSLLAANHTLTELGYTDIQAMQLVEIFRKHDEQLVLDASAHKDNIEQLLAMSSEGRRELEQLFKQDNRL